jgi:hypothetical protein
VWPFQHFIKYWGQQQIKRRIGRRRRRRRIADLSVLSVELFGNVGLLVHGVRTNKQTKKKKKNEKQIKYINQKHKREEDEERGQIGLFAPSLSLPLSSLLLAVSDY